MCVCECALLQQPEKSSAERKSGKGNPAVPHSPRVVVPVCSSRVTVGMARDRGLQLVVLTLASQQSVPEQSDSPVGQHQCLEDHSDKRLSSQKASWCVLTLDNSYLVTTFVWVSRHWSELDPLCNECL